VYYTHVFIFSDKILTKLSLEHILYPIRGPAFLRQNYNINHPSNGTNNNQYVMYTAKNNSFYGVKAPTKLTTPETLIEDHSLEVIQVYHEDSPSQANFCLSKQTLQVMM
jgi:hypothetical protein